MKKVLFVGFALVVGAFAFVTSPLVTEVSAQTSPSTAFCQMLESIISAGMLKEDKISAARLAAGCLDPVATSTDEVALITDPALRIIYDSSEQETRIIASSNISITADPDEDLRIYSDSNPILFKNLTDESHSYNGAAHLLRGSANIGSETDIYGRNIWKIMAGQTGYFTIQSNINPKIIFAGEYIGQFKSIIKVIDQDSSILVPFPNNQTNSILVIGEKSPYLSKVTFVKRITDGFSGVIVEGARLSTTQTAEVRCNNAGNVSSKPYYTSPADDISTTSFVIVDPVKNNDTCWISVIDPEYGASNLVDFKTKGTENRPPVIRGVSAPTLLGVGEMGTWIVKASDPENGQLSYSVDWGDVANSRSVEKNTTTARRPVTSEAQFTHSYSKIGKYTINFEITDDSGQSAYSSVTVRVQVDRNDDPRPLPDPVIPDPIIITPVEIAPVSYTLPGKTVLAGATQEFVLEKTVDIKSLVVNWTDNKTDCQAQVSVGNTNSGWKDVSSPGSLSLTNVGNANRITISAKNAGAKCSGVVVSSVGVSGLAEVALKQNSDRNVSGTASAFVAWESIVKLIQALR